MGRGNRGKKKSTNLALTELLENNNQQSEVSGGFSYSQCLTNSKRKKNKKNQEISYSSVVDSNKDMDESNLDTKFDTTSEFNINSEFEANENDTNIEDIEAPPPKLTFFDKNDDELELYEKRMIVDMFVNRYWNRICVCAPIEDIIIENDNDNDSDEYFNDDY